MHMTLEGKATYAESSGQCLCIPVLITIEASAYEMLIDTKLFSAECNPC